VYNKAIYTSHFSIVLACNNSLRNQLCQLLISTCHYGTLPYWVHIHHDGWSLPVM